MKQRTKEILLAIFLGGILPAIFFRVAQKSILSKREVPQTQQQAQISQQPTTQASVEQKIPVFRQDSSVEMMDIDTYVTAVVLAEMPGDFETEALKAQAVAARTYALKRMKSGNKHPQQAVCTDAACCQAFCEDAELTKSAETIAKVRDAVEQTRDLVLTYHGNLIEATYFSCSGGRTEDAVAVWGEQIPYLLSVESPGEETAIHYVDTVSFSTEEFSKKLGRDFSQASGKQIGAITYTEGGGVENIYIGDQLYTGTQIRSLLGLRSTAFCITVAGDTVTITTKGFGHRVGMSQYGADAMAAQGSTYDQILQHYYPGTTLEKWSDN